MSQRTVSNHFVPQAYLRNWSTDSLHVWTYSTLVPNDRHPLWTYRHIRSIARLSDLYTSRLKGADSDAFERWLNAEVESPASEPLERVRTDRPLRDTDWSPLLKYVASLDLRTPLDYIQSVERWKSEIPDLFDRTLKGVPAAIRRGRAWRRSVGTQSPPNDVALPMKVGVVSDGNEHSVGAEIVIGRALWLHRIRHLVTNTVPILLRNRWSIVRPAEGMEWFTSDHPVVRLNFRSAEDYDFGGGWGSPGSEILVPLSPSHLLYTQVGKPLRTELQFSAETTFRVQKLIAEKAFRRIIASEPLTRVSWFHPRRVDLDACRAEELAWKKWNSEQGTAEAEIA